MKELNSTMMTHDDGETYENENFFSVENRETVALNKGISDLAKSRAYLGF